MLSAFRGESRLGTWLARIVINEALGRKRRRALPLVPLETAMESTDRQMQGALADHPDDQPERAAMRSEMRLLMEARIDELPEAFRTVFMLRAVEESTVEEVAAALGIPEATVRSRFFRARGLLREGLSRDADLATGDAFAFAGARCDRIVAGVLSRL
jgi:RNA polymerase sigma-70 factor (ECF subfamily)